MEKLVTCHYCDGATKPLGIFGLLAYFECLMCGATFGRKEKK